MSEKKKKGIAILLYAAYAIFLTLLLIFGKEVAGLANKVVRGVLDRKDILDVTTDISPDEELIAGKNYYPAYIAHGDFRGDDGLIFESLDPEYLTVKDRGALKANTDFEGDTFDARVRVTSKYDKDFEKVFTFRFAKVYPETFSSAYFTKGYGHAAKTVPIGVPVYAFSYVKPGVDYNVEEYELIYDEEYFSVAEDGALIPIKVTEPGKKLFFTVKYANGATKQSSKFTIIDAAPVDSFDEVKLCGKTLDEYTGTRSKGVVLTLFKDGEPIPTDYTLTFENEKDIFFTGAGHVAFRTIGDKKVIITLPNGFSQDVVIKIRNKITLPTVSDQTVNSTHVINMTDLDVKTYKLNIKGSDTYDKVKFEYDKSMLSIKVESHSFTLTPKSHGTTEIKLVIDDGYTRVEDVFTVNIEENKDLIAIIRKNVQIFVSKVLGHMSLFACLAVLAMNLFKYCYILDPFARLITYMLMGLPFAAITEYAQTFIPGRSGRVQDVLIDMSGFIVGTLLVLLYRLLRDKIKLARENREKAIMRKRRKGIKARENLRSKRKV